MVLAAAPVALLAAGRSTREWMLARGPGRRSAAALRARILGVLRFLAAARSLIETRQEAPGAAALEAEAVRRPAARTTGAGAEAAGPPAERTRARAVQEVAEAAAAQALGRRTARRMPSRRGAACHMWCSSWCPPAASLASASSVWNPLQIR